MELVPFMAANPDNSSPTRVIIDGTTKSKPVPGRNAPRESRE
jgi:hypothetical protein